MALTEANFPLSKQRELEHRRCEKCEGVFETYKDTDTKICQPCYVNSLVGGELKSEPIQESSPEQKVNVLNLYRIQDDDCPMYVLAANYGEAIYKWMKAIAKANNETLESVEEPAGVFFLGDAREIIL